MNIIPIQPNNYLRNNIDFSQFGLTAEFVEDKTDNHLQNGSPEINRQAYIHNFLIAITKDYVAGCETDEDIDTNPNNPERLLGKTLGGLYQIQEHIGSGGMAHVYKALNIKTNNPVAIKVMKNSNQDDKKLSGIFSREKEMKKFGHKNILEIYDFGDDNGNRYLVTELMRNGTLKEPEINLSLHQKILLVADICDALQYIHDNNIIHRDVKPENILLSDKLTNDECPTRPIIKLGDFGLALIPNISSTNTTVSGSALYMSPEQINGEKNPTGLSDLYSVGVILYELATGKVPFNGQGKIMTLLNQQKNSLPTLPSQINPNIPARLESIIMELLQKKPEHRHYKSASELAKDLRAFFLL